MSPDRRRGRKKITPWIPALAALGTLATLALSVMWSDLSHRGLPAPEPEPARAPAAPRKAQATNAPATTPGVAAVQRKLASVAAPPLKPARGSRGATFGKRDPYHGLPVVSFEETQPDPNGNFQRLRVVQTHMKYPYIRVEEKLRRDFATGEDTLVAMNAMAADHVLLRLHDGYSPDDLKQMAKSLGMTVTKESPVSRMYLLSFDSKDVHALERGLEVLKAQQMVASPEPDYVVRPN